LGKWDGNGGKKMKISNINLITTHSNNLNITQKPFSEVTAVPDHVNLILRITIS